MPPPVPPPAPRALVGEGGRERLLGLLREHYARGRLELAEMSRRVDIVLRATYADEAAAAVTDLPPLSGVAPSESAARPSRGPAGQRRRHAQQAEPGAGWVPTPERFRDPSTRAIVRVWVDPADLSRHYVPEPDP